MDPRETEVGQTRVAGSKPKAQLEVEATRSCTCRVGRCRAESFETANSSAGQRGRDDLHS